MRVREGCDLSASEWGQLPHPGSVDLSNRVDVAINADRVLWVTVLAELLRVCAMGGGVHESSCGVMEDAFMHTGEEVLAHFECLGTDGLTEEEVAGRRLRFGRNEIPSEEGVPFWKLVLKQARGIRCHTVTQFAVRG